MPALPEKGRLCGGIPGPHTAGDRLPDRRCLHGREMMEYLEYAGENLVVVDAASIGMSAVPRR